MKLSTETLLKAFMVGLIFIGAASSQAADTIPVSENGWASCPVSAMSGCRNLSDYTAKRDALQACKNYGGIPVGSPYITDSDCRMDYNGYTSKECRSQASVKCYLR